MAALLGVGGIAAIGGLACGPSTRATCSHADRRARGVPDDRQRLWGLAPMPVEETTPAPPAETGPGNRASSDGKPCHPASRTCRTARLSDGDRRRCRGGCHRRPTAQIAALEAASAEAQRALERQLTERDRELDQLRMDLEGHPWTPEPGTSGIGAEDAALAELERRRIAEAEARAERIASPMIAFSGMGSDADRDDAQEAARLNEDEAFGEAQTLPP